jgi:hypothetical protein
MSCSPTLPRAQRRRPPRRSTSRRSRPAGEDALLPAMDLGGDRQDQLSDHARNLRNFLDTLPDRIRDIVGYQAAWKLLFGEEF